MKRVLLVTEYLNPPYDEGIKKTIYNLFKILDENYNLCVICRYGFEKDNIHIVKTNSLFLSSRVRKIIHNFNPDILLYFPFVSMTFASYLRLFMLKKYVGKIKTIIIALQPKPIKKWQKMIVKYLKPTIALTPSPQLQKMWVILNIDNKLLPLYTNLKEFNPIEDISLKKKLRKKYKIPDNKFVISHMGHLNEGRNLETLIPLQNAGFQIVIVGSSSTPLDSIGPISLKKKLIDSSIIIIDRYLDNIAEIYQLSDLYVFPVLEKCSSIGLPLSILEARACGIPVLTTEFGSVKDYLNDDFDNVFYSNPHNFLATIKTIEKKSTNKLSTIVGRINEEYRKAVFFEIEEY